LELLLPLAQAYRVPLDDLVGAPEVGDPRIRLKASKVNGRIVLPLTRTPGGVQAWKIIVPASNSEPQPKSHEGHEWLSVLAGRMRLVLGEYDLVLGAGEAAEFDTRVPHWFGSTGEQSAEILSMFGPQGERAHTKARSVRGQDSEGLPLVEALIFRDALHTLRQSPRRPDGHHNLWRRGRGRKGRAGLDKGSLECPRITAAGLQLVGRRSSACRAC
jgi:mannose-6-phosphate isomerase-like protein (cupin superfamily)